MTRILKAVFATAALIGLLVGFLALQSLEYPGTLAFPESRYYTLFFIGAAVAITGVLGFKSLDK